jgi:hypothetical protein
MKKLIFLIIYTFILLESGLYLLERIEYKNNFDPLAIEMYMDARDKDHLFEYKPNLDLIINSDYGTYEFKTNDLGIRETVNYSSLEKSIILLGDSVVSGSFVSDSYLFDKIIEDKLNIPTLNFGVDSSNTIQELAFIKNKYSESFNTKLIVLGYTNDYVGNSYTRYFDEKLGGIQIYEYIMPSNNNDYRLSQQIKNILKKSRALVLINHMLYLADNLISENINSVEETKFIKNDYLFDLSLEYIHATKEFANEIGAEFLVAFFPGKSGLDLEINDESRLPPSLREALAEDGIESIDLYYELKAQISLNNKELYVDGNHFNKLGHKVIGDYLSIIIKEKYSNILELE